MSSAYKLTPIESLRACSVIEEALEKMHFLGSITPDILQHREELSQIVGEEISRIIHDQRQLEAKYETLVAQRTVLKGLANKSKFKENQREIQEVSRLLRESTKSLCRNLKENPNFAGNLLKVQQERDALIDLLTSTLHELHKHGTFDVLLSFVSDGKSSLERNHEILRKEKDSVEEVKKLTNELQREKNDHQREVHEHKNTILQLKEQLLAVKSKTQIDIRYARNEAKAKRASTSRMYRQLVEEQEKHISQLEQKKQLESRVHEETLAFLKERQDHLQNELLEWTQKYQQEISAKQQELATLQQHKQTVASRLAQLDQRWQQEMLAIQKKEQERKHLEELEVLKKEELKAQNTAARIIQVAYRAWKLQKEERKKALESEKKKGKKGKKGKK